MGTFLGHVFPGTFFIFFALLWTKSIFRRFYRLRPNAKFHSQPSYLLVEGYLKFGVALFGILAEAYTGLSADWRSLEPHNKQHILMYSFFVINGLFDILVMSRHLDQPQPPTRTNAVLPPDTQRATLLQALIVEFVLFSFHLMNRSELDRHLHVLLLICNAFAIAASCAEWLFQQNVVVALARSFASMFMGTWLIQIAFILHNPFTAQMTWPTEGHHAIMEATSLYILHALGNTLVVFLLGYMSCQNVRPGYDGLATEIKINSDVPAIDSEDEYEFGVEPATLTQVSTDKKTVNYR